MLLAVTSDSWLFLSTNQPPNPTPNRLSRVQVPISCLQWEHRLPLILQEVREADADIICLQELNHFGESSNRS